MTLIALLVWILVFCAVIWAVRAIAAAFNLPSQLQTVLTVVIVLVGLLYLLDMLGLVSGGPMIRLR